MSVCNCSKRHVIFRLLCVVPIWKVQFFSPMERGCGRRGVGRLRESPQSMLWRGEGESPQSMLWRGEGESPQSMLWRGEEGEGGVSPIHVVAGRGGVSPIHVVAERGGVSPIYVVAGRGGEGGVSPIPVVTLPPPPPPPPPRPCRHSVRSPLNLDTDNGQWKKQSGVSVVKCVTVCSLPHRGDHTAIKGR